MRNAITATILTAEALADIAVLVGLLVGIVYFVL